MKKRSSVALLLLSILLIFSSSLSVTARDEPYDENDLANYMEENIYDAQKIFSEHEVTPARGFSLFLQIDDLNEDGMVEAGMTAYLDSEEIRAVQINKASNKDLNILGVYCGDYLADAYDRLMDCHYELKSSTRNPDGSYSDEYTSYMDIYTLNVTTDKETKVTSLYLMKTVG